MGKRTQPRIYVILRVWVAELFRHDPGKQGRPKPAIIHIGVVDSSATVVRAIFLTTGRSPEVAAIYGSVIL